MTKCYIWTCRDDIKTDRHFSPATNAPVFESLLAAFQMPENNLPERTNWVFVTLTEPSVVKLK
jgi:hypothetical protein